MADLFAHGAHLAAVGYPLAERMRPRSLAEFVAAGNVVGAERVLARVRAGQVPSSHILYGPPGTGKTTFARLLSQTAGLVAVELSAVSAGVKELREVAETAERERTHYQRRTLLFVDEIHRFSRAQQDALLPHVERGTFVLCGATTENPGIALSGALLSRCHAIAFHSHRGPALEAMLDAALTDRERGLGKYGVTADAAVRAQLVDACGGDARRLLNVLEAAVDLAIAAERGALTLEDLELALRGQVKAYAARGDVHYALASALIKSLRGSDADAAVYWMVRMLEAGEDPMFVSRRLIIFASEDIGNAEPQALVWANAAHQALQAVGMPEASFALTQVVVALALAPKSNTALRALAAARRLVTHHGDLPVPMRLRPGTTALARAGGEGVGYRYPHDFEGAYVPERYLPEALAGQEIVTIPSPRGQERELAAKLLELREANAAVGQGNPVGFSSPES